MKKPSDRLLNLVEQWNDELEAFLRAEKIFMTHMDNILDIGSKIYHLRKSEGIEDHQLNMKHREQPKEENPSSPRKRRLYKRGQGLKKENPPAEHNDSEVHENDA